MTSDRKWMCNGTVTDDAFPRGALGDVEWLLPREEMERLAADTTRKMDEAVAATSWSTTAAIDATTLSRATAQEDLEYFARLAGYMPKCEHSREWYSVMCVVAALRMSSTPMP